MDCNWDSPNLRPCLCGRLGVHPGKEALELAGHLLSAAHCMGVFTDADKASMPLEGAYTIVDWLLKCTQHVDDNVIRLLHRSMKDVLCCQDEEAQAMEVAKVAAEKVRDHSQDSARRQCYREAQDHDSEPSNSEKEASKALS